MTLAPDPPHTTAPGAVRPDLGAEANDASSLVAAWRRWMSLFTGGAGMARPPAGAAVVERAGAARAAPAAAPGVEPSVFERALEALPEPMMILSAPDDPTDFIGQRIAFANAAARELLRIPREGALLVSALRRPEVLEAADEALFGGVARDVAFAEAGVQERAWRLHATPLPAGADGRRLALAHLRDETDARRAERMRVDFLANASHELRTPLASLAGFIETLSGHARDDAPARDQFLRIMARQAERMRRLIEDLMSLSRIELNEHVPPAGVCDVALAVADAIDASGPIAQAKRVAVRFSPPPRGAAEIPGDRDQIIQVVQNLLDNAVKYAPEGEAVTIEVTPGLTVREAAAADAPAVAGAGGGRLSLLTPDRREEDVRYVAVRVSGPGPGIAREHLPRLSERFYRVEGQKSGDKLGTGLGLAIVKHIANRHRGGVVVESAPGEGAAFCAYFPARPPPAVAVVADAAAKVS